MKPSDFVKMRYSEFKKEHGRLLNVLKNPTKGKLKEEAKKQSEEAKGYEGRKKG